MVGGGWAISEDEALEHVYRVEVDVDDDVVVKLTLLLGLKLKVDAAVAPLAALVAGVDNDGGGSGIVGGAIKAKELLLLSMLTEAEMFLASEFVTRESVLVVVLDVLTAVVTVSLAVAIVAASFMAFFCGSVSICSIPTHCSA